jgi:hypothetical protein
MFGYIRYRGPSSMSHSPLSCGRSGGRGRGRTEGARLAPACPSRRARPRAAAPAWGGRGRHAGRARPALDKRQAGQGKKRTRARHLEGPLPNLCGAGPVISESLRIISAGQACGLQRQRMATPSGVAIRFVVCWRRCSGSRYSSDCAMSSFLPDRSGMEALQAGQTERDEDQSPGESFQ